MFCKNKRKYDVEIVDIFNIKLNCSFQKLIIFMAKKIILNFILMKKLYSLIAVAGIAVAVNAQGTENFDGLSNTDGTSYTTVNFSGADNTTWALASARVINTSANYNINGSSVILNSGGTATITFPNGVGTLTYQYRKAFTGKTARTMQVSVDGVVAATSAQFGSGSGEQTTVYTQTVEINRAGSVTVEIKALGAQVTIDNVSWTAPDVLAVYDANTSKKSLVKNTSVENDLVFAAKSDVKVYNVNGQIVKSASVNENTSLNVSTWPKGIYIVSGNVDGEAVSQKIIKK